MSWVSGFRLVLKRLLLTLAVMAAILGLARLGYLNAGVILSYPAGQPHSADLVVVLGGDGGARYPMGTELVLDGNSARLLLINPGDSIRKDALGRLRGVDVRFDTAPRNTWEEAQAVRATMLAQGWRSVLVVSDPPHMLRLHYAWFSNFWGADLSYTLIATNPPWWSAWQWWQNPVAKEFVKSEVLKLGYYVVQYRFGLW